ncbi:pilus assembly protein TadG-related protein [Arthrobacter caoxuetaonis]|uniref:Pilus assembly protein TadG-related protein n=1 Tax=Arthrobacter caoxuetaonis TaxID=2886935 RepID=A0A9X1MB89_9MICC|nr:pilus assembly protein TadG-related protein [Arthrobacter caoxuetaonis]MCC3296799.1 pilus assembly protein TadG-related protein [Arthrobacter caoxuetaonis]USQ56383.1 pilus assembly protein TadG-related protein [Arthrobacter caoxuetaonis]
MSEQHTGDGESGQVGVLIIGYVLLALLVITVVAGASSVYLGHKKLLSAADGAALAAADTFSLSQVQGTEPGTAPAAQLESGAVTAAVQQYLADSRAGERITALQISPETGTPDARTARVVLLGAVHPPIVNFLVPDGIPIRAESDARARLTR